jgi:hypothetical protein
MRVDAGVGILRLRTPCTSAGRAALRMTEIRRLHVSLRHRDYFSRRGVMLSVGWPTACGRADGVEASLLAPQSFICEYHPRLKSTQSGFSDSINAIFLLLRQPFSCFSRSMAVSTSSKDSQYSKRSTSYLLVKPANRFSLCWKTRFSGRLGDANV